MVGSNILLSMVVQQLVAILVFLQEKMRWRSFLGLIYKDTNPILGSKGLSKVLPPMHHLGG